MQRPNDIYGHNINDDTYDEKTPKACDEFGLQSHQKPFNSESLNLHLKYGKSQPNNTSRETTDFRHAFSSVLSERLKNRLQSDNRNVKQDFAISADITNDSTKHWTNLSKRMSSRSTRSSLVALDESDNYDTDTINSERSPTAAHCKASPRTDSASKVSSCSFNDDLYNESLSSACSVLAKKSSTILLDSKASNQTQIMNEKRLRRKNLANNLSQVSDINIIMLSGLLIGVFVSKVLQYLLSYLGWFQCQVLHLRNIFLGKNCSLSEFCNFDDTARYCLRTKILLLPLIGTCSLLYGLSSVLNVTLRCLLTQAPSSMIKFIQRLYLNP